MNHSFRLFAFPLKLKISNGYWDGLYGEILKDSNVTGYNNNFSKLIFSFGHKNIIHIHWPAILYSSRFSFVVPIKLFIRLSILIFIRLRGDTLVWTLHNYKNHEGRYRFFERIAIWFLKTFSYSVIVHTQAGADYLNNQLRRSKRVYIVPHGNYINFHGAILDEPDQDLMKIFGLRANDKVFLSLGSIRPYKGLEKLIEVFNNLPVDNKLLITGKSFYPEYINKLKEMVKGENIIFQEYSISGDDLPKYFSLAIFSVYSFSDILTSGSVILSLSYAVPVIVPDSGDLHYIIQNGLNGFKYQDTEMLKKYIEDVAKFDSQTIKSMKKNSLDNIQQISYKQIAAQTLDAYGVNF